MTGNKKGMSDIVVTLIIVLLSIVAIGIVWNVVKNLIDSQKEGIESGTRCLHTEVSATAVNCVNATTNKNCTVTLARSGSATDTLAGVKFTFEGQTPAGVPIIGTTVIRNTTLVSAGGEVFTNIDAGITNANWITSLKVVPFYKDAYGVEDACTASTKDLSFK